MTQRIDIAEAGAAPPLQPAHAAPAHASPRRWRFSHSLSIVVAIAMLGLALFSSIVNTREASERMKTYMREQGREITANLARQSVLALLLHSAENAQVAVDTSLAFPDVLQVAIVDTKGKVLVRQARKRRDGGLVSAQPLPLLEGEQSYVEADEVFYFKVPVLSEPEDSAAIDAYAAKPTVLGHVHVAVGKASLDRLVLSLFVSNLGVTLIFAAILFALQRLISGRLLRPLHALSQLMRRAENGEAHLRATLAGPQDIIEMGQAFNKMMAVLEGRETHLEQMVKERTRNLEQANAQLEQTLATVQAMQSDLVRSEKMAALGSLVAGVAHELNTPIGNCVMMSSTMKAHSRELLSEVESGTLRKSMLERYARERIDAIEVLERNLARAAELIGSFKNVAADRTSDHRRSFDLERVLRETMHTLTPMWRKRDIALALELDAGIEMDSYPGGLGQVLTNFVSNALAHAFEGEAGGSMILRSERIDAHSVLITFSDTGAGIAPENLSRVFDPFFTTKMGAGGTGLGMNIVYNIVTSLLGGTIEVASTVGAGTTFTMRIPLTAPARRALEAPIS
ncbi:MAG: HAMP domain-containing sensor histidine kinase [Pseudomonadota bacterium]